MQYSTSCVWIYPCCVETRIPSTSTDNGTNALRSYAKQTKSKHWLFKNKKVFGCHFPFGRRSNELASLEVADNSSSQLCKPAPHQSFSPSPHQRCLQLLADFGRTSRMAVLTFLSGSLLPREYDEKQRTILVLFVWGGHPSGLIFSVGLQFGVSASQPVHVFCEPYHVLRVGTCQITPWAENGTSSIVCVVCSVQAWQPTEKRRPYVLGEEEKNLWRKHSEREAVETMREALSRSETCNLPFVL